MLLQVHKSILESFWPNTFCRKLLYQHKVISYKEHMNAEIKIRIQCFLGGKVAKKQFGLVSLIKNIQKVSAP